MLFRSEGLERGFERNCIWVHGVIFGVFFGVEFALLRESGGGWRFKSAARGARGFFLRVLFCFFFLFLQLSRGENMFSFVWGNLACGAFDNTLRLLRG